MHIAFSMIVCSSMLSIVTLMLVWINVCVGDTFHEELLLRPLTPSMVSAHFRFTTLSDLSFSTSNSSHLDLVPRHVSELIQTLGISQLSSSLTRGVWRSSKWGEAQEAPNPPGAHLEAIFDSAERVEARWRELTQALAGQWCASINFMDDKLAVTSQWSHPTLGVDKAKNASFVKMRALLPSEIVCTENLTPWKKLLPCEAKRGLATLLNARETQKSVYHSLGLTVRRVCNHNPVARSSMECVRPSLEIVQHASFVFDLRLQSQPKMSSDNWSLRRLFGLGLHSRCPVAKTSNVYFVNKVNNGLHMTLSTQNKSIDSIHGWHVQRVDVGDMVSRREANIQVEMMSSSASSSSSMLSSLRVSKHQVGFGQEQGSFIVRIFNPLPRPLKVSYLDVYPWYLRMYLHSLKLSYRRIGSGEKKRSLKTLKTNFVPGVDRRRPYVLECLIELPASSETEVSIDFEKSLLKWSEYPPDANHGFTVGSTAVNALVPKDLLHNIQVDRHFSTFEEHFSTQHEHHNEDHLGLWRLFSEAVLVSLPTPDFSMPYNVICLTCTVVAMAFGPLHNLTTMDLRVVSKEDNGDESLISKLKRKVANKLGWRKTEKKDEDDDSKIEDEKEDGNNDEKELKAKEHLENVKDSM